MTFGEVHVWKTAAPNLGIESEFEELGVVVVILLLILLLSIMLLMLLEEPWSAKNASLDDEE